MNPDLTRPQSPIIGSFNQWEMLVGTLTTAVAVFDREMRYVMVNQRWIQDHAIHINMIGCTFYETFPEPHDLWKEFHARALAGETVVNPEDRMIAADGVAHFVNWQMFPWVNPGSLMPDGIIMITKDITEIVTTQLKREVNLTESISHARQQAELLASINAALSQANDEQSILGAVAELAELYKVTFSGLSYALLDEMGYPYGSLTAALRSSNGTPIPISALPSTTVLRKNSAVLELAFTYADETIFIEDIATDPRTQEPEVQNFLRASNAIAVILLPLKTGHQWQGILSLVWSTPQKFDRDLHRIFSAVRTTLSSVVASRRAYVTEESLRQHTQALLEISTALSKAVDEQEILASIASVAEKYQVTSSGLSYSLVDEMGVPYAATAVALRAINGIVIPLANLPSLIVERKDSAILEIAFSHSEEAIFIEDVDSDPRCTVFVQDYMKASKAFAAILLPLKMGNQWHGILSLAWETPQKFDQALRSLLTGILPTLTSVVASRRLYLQTLENVARLEELDKLKNEFMSSMSHELRTPLNAVIGLTDIILAGLDGKISERAESDVRTVFNAGQQLLSIVNDVLDIAKIEAGKLELLMTPLKIEEPIREAVDTTHVLADQKGLQLVATIAPNLPLVKADRLRIQQVATNLLSNALRFTESGTVEISAYAENNSVVVCIRDEGIGISPEHHGLIFEQFRQVEGALTRKKGGTGLGLPISKRLIELHSGKVWLESELGQGSKFFFSLPITKDQL